MKKTILISPSSFGIISEEPLNILKNKYNYINNPYGRKLTENEVIELGKRCTGIIAGVEAITERVMNLMPNLKCISRVGVGMDNIDIEVANDKGIIVVNTPDGPTRGVAELTLALTLSMLRKVPQADCAMKSKKWEKQIGNLLHKKTIGIIGLGRIGKMVAEMYRALGNPVLGFDLFPDEAWSNRNQVGLCSFDEILSKSDIISLHIPANKDKSAVIGHREFNLMKDGIFLVNLSRGGVLDEHILFESLKDGKLSAAAIDVFSEEPYSGPLCDLNNIVLTPHIGSYAAEGKLEMEIDAVNNLINCLNNDL
ncbi:MAG: phosphoglycerate dehydrogenase [Bacteroidales bacterium]|jgi:D-3-phosphoglycerate dehydrogenase / 2-oxoglutarate reductase|nr:phosphoglycerate dehydrogenase [Bacteroidales bacterium]